MEYWKEAKLSYLDYCLKNYIDNRKIKNLLYPFNFSNHYTNQMSKKQGQYVISIEKNLQELMLIYYKINKFYDGYIESNMSHYKYLIKTELEHFVLRYRIVVSSIVSIKKELRIVDFSSVDTSYFEESIEYEQLLEVRNNIAHESIRSHIFYTSENKRSSFQFYTNRSLENHIYLHEVFLNPHGSEIYDLKYWLSWMLILLLNFIDDITGNIFLTIQKEYDEDGSMLEEIIKYDQMINNRHSILDIYHDDIQLFINEISELRNHIVKFKSNEK
ncbi:hypothetical protein ABGV40_23115 [Paenibacillus amylolyticus]|uniref:hypothetical protein n=1 Tax=Paenibacillus amylolyticus TaxID=1451 RepID=UPI003241E2B4